jgi:hypothetical protein
MTKEDEDCVGDGSLSRESFPLERVLALGRDVSNGRLWFL